MVDQEEKTLFDRYVKPDVPVVSHLTELTGLTEEHLRDAKGLKEVMADLHKIIDPKKTVIVGQGIEHDLEWLDLQPNRDIKGFVNVAHIFRLRRKDKPAPAASAAAGGDGGSGGDGPAAAATATEAEKPRYIYFSLRHTVKLLLNIDMQENEHSPILDAAYAMRLFNKYKDAPPAYIKAIQQTLISSPVGT